MSTYQVKKHFRWGSFQLEPNQQLNVIPSPHSDGSYLLSRDNSDDVITVSKAAFEFQEKSGSIEKLRS